MGHCTGLYSGAPFPFGVKPVNTCSQSVFGGSGSNSPTRVAQPGKPPALNQLYLARFWLSYTDYLTCDNLWRWVKCVLRHKIAPVAACVTFWNNVLFAFFPKVLRNCWLSAGFWPCWRQSTCPARKHTNHRHGRIHGANRRFRPLQNAACLRVD